MRLGLIKMVFVIVCVLLGASRVIYYLVPWFDFPCSTYCFIVCFASCLFLFVFSCCILYFRVSLVLFFSISSLFGFTEKLSFYHLPLFCLDLLRLGSPPR